MGSRECAAVGRTERPAEPERRKRVFPREIQRERKVPIIIGAKSLRNKVNLDVMRNRACAKSAA
jgi:hypothetical protein